MGKLARLVGAIVASFLIWGPASAQDVRQPPSLEDLLSPADYWSPELSPSGRFVVGVRRVGEISFLLFVDLESPDDTPVSVGLGDQFLNWAEWITDERLLLSVSGFVDLRRGNVLTREQLNDLPANVIPWRFTRVVAIDRNGENSVTMFGDDRSMNRNYSLGTVVSFLKSDPDHILMSAQRGGDLDLFKLDVRDGSFERIAKGTQRTFSWYVDRDGEPAFRFNTNGRRSIIYIHAREDRENGSIRWKRIKTIRLERNEQQEAATEFSPLNPGPTPTTYYVAARPEGEDKTGIYLYDFERDEYLETIRNDADVDIERIIYNRENQSIQGFIYETDRLNLEFLDPDLQAHQTGLRSYFGDQVNVIPTMTNADGRIWLVYTIGPNDPGSYHVYDMDAAYARHIASERFELSRRQLSSVTHVAYTARDGMELWGYLTEPLNPDPSKIPPLIMMPHGGPEIRDSLTFDPTTQFLAANGYRVFQPNFRGSAGFGKAFADQGRRQWGRKMQTDIEDAFHHLVDAGLAEDGRACIMGASYGGYAALAASTLTPELYRCHIAQSAPSDLVEMLKWERKEEGGDSEAYQYWVDHIGDPRTNQAELIAVSPARNAALIQRPVLLIHGADDGVVPFRQSELMKAALDAAGKTYEMVTLEDSRHSYRSDEDEVAEFEAILAFLQKYLPVDATSH